MQGFRLTCICRGLLLGQGLAPSGAAATQLARQALSTATDSPSTAADAAPEHSSAAAEAPSSIGASADEVQESLVDRAMKQIHYNTELRTEQLAVLGTGLTAALERRQKLELDMLLAARRKDLREGRDGKEYAGLLVSEALQRSMAES